MAKERLTLYDKYGNEVDYDVSTEDVTLDNEGGKSLKKKLEEVDDGIGGQVNKVVFNGTTHNASNCSIDIGNQMQPDWNESSPTYPTFIRNKPNVVTGIRIGSSGSTMTPTGGVVTLPESEGGGTVECDTAMSSTSEAPVQNKVIKAYVDAAVQAVQTALNNLMNGQSVTDAIDTFNEIKAFLEGIDTDDPTLFNQLKSLSDAITALQTTLSQKANDNAVVKSISVNGTAQTKDGNGNVNVSVPTLTFDDAPTAGSNNPVKSRGIKTAIEQVTPTINENGKWVIGGVTTTHDAQGPAGNIIIEDANDMVALIVNDLTTGGQANFLSAEMGKALLSLILQIFGNLGEYAFPNGKPTLNFNTQVSFPISYSQSDQHVTYADGQGNTVPSTVGLLGRLEIQLGTDNDLYVINESAVKVFVGGTEVANAYDPTTDKIIIPEVYGNVVIIAQAWTYVDRGLVMHLDGKNGRSVAHRWDSLVNYNNSPLYFKLENCDESNSDYVGFDKDDNSCGIAYSDAAFQNQVTLLDVPAASGTIEFAATGMAETSSVCVMHNNIGSGNRILFAINSITNDNTKRNVAYSTSPLSTATNGGALYATGVKQGYFSALSNSVKVNGTDLEMYPVSTGAVSFFANAASYLALLKRHADTASPVDVYYSANLYALRVYSIQLTDVERAQNLAIDRKRFNLGY